MNLDDISTLLLIYSSHDDPAVDQVIGEPSAIPLAGRSAAVLLWIVAAGWGLPAPWLIWWVLTRSRLPIWPIIGEPYGGPFYFNLSRDTFVALLAISFVLAFAQGWAAWLLWAGKRSGALLQFGLLPVEAVFWYGFALPIPPLFAILRVVLTVLAWRGLT